LINFFYYAQFMQKSWFHTRERREALLNVRIKHKYVDDYKTITEDLPDVL